MGREHRTEDEERLRDLAIDAIMAAPPSEVPEDPAEIRRELDEAHDRCA